MQTFTDIDLNFIRHPGTGDVTRLFNLDAIRNSIMNIVSGKPFEKPFDEFYGTGIRGILFSLNTPITQAIVRRIVKERLELYEPRITVDDVVINGGTEKEQAYAIDRHELNIEISYTVKNYGTQTVKIEMERVR